MGAGLVLVLAATPYLTWAHTRYGLQPFAPLVAAAFLALTELPKIELSAPRSIWVIIAVALYAALCSLFGLLAFNPGPGGLAIAARSAAPYGSLALFIYFGYRYSTRLPRSAILAACLLWAVAMIVQLTLGPSSLLPILPRVSTGGVRGLTGLGPEPAIAAKNLVLLMIILDLTPWALQHETFRSSDLVRLLLVAMVLMTKSGTAVVLLILYFGARACSYLISKRGGRRLTKGALQAAAAALVLGGFILMPFLSRARGGLLLGQLISSPQALMTSEGSVTRRLVNPLLAVRTNDWVSSLFGHISLLGSDAPIQRDTPAILMHLAHGSSVPTAPMGGLPGAVYDLGVVGALLSLTLLVQQLRCLHRAASPSFRQLLPASAILLTLLGFSGSLATPLLGIALGMQLAILNATRHQDTPLVPRLPPYPETHSPTPTPLGRRTN